MSRLFTSSDDFISPSNFRHMPKSQRRSAKKLRLCTLLVDTKAARVVAVRDANPRPEQAPQQTSFVDPRSQAKLAAVLAPVPVAKKRTYKAKSKVTESAPELLTEINGIKPSRKTARIYGTMDEDGI